jgi:hypothetical protein
MKVYQKLRQMWIYIAMISIMVRRLVLGGINKPIQAVKVRVPWDGHLAHQCTKCQYPEWYANFRRLVLA